MGTRTSDKRAAEIARYALEHDDALACADFGVTEETLARYKRLTKNADSSFEVTATLKKIQAQYSDMELRAIAKGGRIMPGQPRVPIVHFDGECITFAHITDTHIGSIFFREQYLKQAFEECEREKVQLIFHTGDVTDGMSNRPDHIYELTHIGYEKQKTYAIELLQSWDKPLYMVSGNHDRYFLKSSGAYIVKDICESIPEAHYMGEDEGDMSLNGVTVRLWHGEDYSSYAHSYRIQKLIESFTGGTKPNVLLCGHTHKQIYMFDRHIHCISGGALSIQSRWMRSKRMANHTGFWIIRMWTNNNSVTKLQTTWMPFYV